MVGVIAHLQHTNWPLMVLCDRQESILLVIEFLLSLCSGLGARLLLLVLEQHEQHLLQRGDVAAQLADARGQARHGWQHLALHQCDLLLKTLKALQFEEPVIVQRQLLLARILKEQQRMDTE